MGRHHEVRAAAMAATAKAKSAAYMRASKEIYAAAKSGGPDPDTNLALRQAIEKYRKTATKDVIERAIARAAGGEATNYIEGRYEFMGPGGCNIIVDTLSDNANRALVSVRTTVGKRGGSMGSCAYNFTQGAVLDFTGVSRDAAEEALILGDVDVSSVEEDEGEIEVVCAPNDLEKAKTVLKDLGVTEYDTAEVTLVPNEWITLSDENLAKVKNMLADLDEVEDVQNVYHNVENI